ncbi:MAG TPA: GNAT family N-acetyltransferase [Candidatus Limnocylindrales bacterium]|nr:GNAT family N-acetyltransferase [Candidatus Limnocylindrales bacterium]
MTTEASAPLPDVPDVAHVPDAPRIAGLRFRHPRLPEDWATIAALRTAAFAADGIEEVSTPEDLAADWGHLDDVDLDRDLLLAELDGRVVGFALGRVMPRDDQLALETWGNVHPDARRRGIGTALHRWARARAAELAAADPRPEPREYRSWGMEAEVGNTALLEAEGFRRIRYGFEMRRPLTGALPTHPLPDGLELRPLLPEHYRTVFAAEDEAFRDHWGHHPFTEGDFKATFDHPDFDPTLWQVAWDGDEVAGVVFVSVFRAENEQLGLARGWLNRVSVRRPWRGRGLAKALCASACAALRARGLDEAWLGVDAANPTGALRLYEELGFTVAHRWFAFGRPLDDAG